MGRKRQAVLAGKSFTDDPQWQAMKAVRRNLDHDAAVQESVALEKQYRSMWSSKVAASPVDLNEILRTLNAKKIPFVLTSASAIGGWTGRPRGTHDVDILVKQGRNHDRAVKAIRELYPKLVIHRQTGVTAFLIPGERESVIDVMYPDRGEMEEARARPVWTVNSETGLRYRIVSLEAALANKYAAMLRPTRDLPKRQQDIVDFTFMVKHSSDEGQRPIDLKKLEELGEMVWPGGGGKEILRLVEKCKADEPINIDSTHKLI